MTLQDLWLSVAYTALFAVVFGAIEFVKRRFGAPTEVMRRVAHMASGLLLILDFYTLSPTVFVVLITGGGVLFYVLSQRKIFTSVNDVARRSVGQYVLTVGYLAAYGIAQFDMSVFIPSVLIITFADSLAGLYGTLIGAERRTIVGSAIFFAVALLVLVGAAGVAVLPAIAMAAALTLVERFTPLGFDNVSIPLVSALLLLAF